jgi:hypothetical protein
VTGLVEKTREQIDQEVDIVDRGEDLLVGQTLGDLLVPIGIESAGVVAWVRGAPGSKEELEKGVGDWAGFGTELNGQARQRSVPGVEGGLGLEERKPFRDPLGTVLGPHACRGLDKREDFVDGLWSLDAK